MDRPSASLPQSSGPEKRPAGPLPSATSALPYATAHLPGCGGRIKSEPEDFVVEELPLYEPAGEGEHLYLWVEKRGIGTPEVSRALARALGIGPAAIGHVGLKDARAVTRQWLSAPTPDDPDPATLAGPGWRVLAASRHRNKLRPGHLRGNRFEIAVRGLERPEAVAPLLDQLRARGFPNVYGPQRFGARGDNADLGRAALGDGNRAAGGRNRRRFLTQALQAELFNRVLALRLAHDPDPGSLHPGDLAMLHRSGGCFRVDEAGLTDARARADAHEISPSGPLYGHRVDLAEGLPGEWERAVLAEAGLALADFRRRTKAGSLRGARRAGRAFTEGLDGTLGESGGETVLRLAFTLPPGVYATALLRELLKSGEL